MRSSNGPMTIGRQLSAIVLLWRAGQLVRDGNPAKILCLTAAKAGLTSDDYSAPERLRSKLAAYLDGMPGPLERSGWCALIEAFLAQTGLTLEPQPP